MFPPSSLRCLLALCLTLMASAPAHAAPYRPASDQQVVEILLARLADPRQRELRELRRALAARPGDPDLAVRLARRYYAEVAAEGDPRYVSYAQAALAPWWQEPAAPPGVRLMRAVLLQFSYQFDAARADLRAVVQVDPDNGEAWAWLLAIILVQADYVQARQACERLPSLAPALIGSACMAQLDALTGHSTRAAAHLRAALARDAAAEPEQRLWALTRLAEIEQRRGEHAAAEVLALLRERTRSDLLLLRLALAARFDAARLRGDALHQKEEARFALALQGQSERALVLASDNYAVQREPADARMLLEAALAAKRPDAARPALQWMAETGYDGVTLKRFAQALKGAR